ncbi:MAG: MFS transporter [Candidatus Margulisbacteria bacterium]|nr:MFS transporter [Candidatus Margulisiibacteriota bacterium]
MDFVKKIFRTLKYKNYRIFFTTQIVSLIGIWMQQIAMIWLIYRLTNSLILLGLMGFLSQIPSLFISPVAGVFADRHDKKRLLIFTQILFAVIALFFAYLVYRNELHIHYFLILGLIFGFINAFDIPVRQSFFIELIDNKKDVTNAVALNSVAFHGARLIGPAIAGFIIKWLGEDICFLLNGLSYIPVILALMFMIKIPAIALEKQKKVTIYFHFQEGIQYIIKSRVILPIITLVGIISLMGMSYVVLLPAFVKEVYHGDSALLGFFMSAAGAGALTGAIYLASREKVTNLVYLMVITSGILGFSLVTFSIAHNVYLSLIMLICVGFSMMMQLGGSNVLLQTITENKLRGRIMSIYSIAFAGTVPIGNLLAGFISHNIGIRLTLSLGGLCCLLAGIWFNTHIPGVRETVRKIYSEF